MNSLLVALLNRWNTTRIHAAAWIVWTCDESSNSEIVAAEGFGRTNLADLHTQWRGNAELLRQATTNRQPIRARAKLSTGQGGQRPLEIVTVPVTSVLPGVILQLFFYEAATADQFQRDLFSNEELTELQAAWDVNAPASQRQSSRAAEQSSLLVRLSEQLSNIPGHRQLPGLLDTFCLHYGASRCALFQRSGRHTTFVAISGTSRQDNRSETIRQFHRLAQNVPAPTQTCLIPVEADSVRMDQLIGDKLHAWWLSPDPTAADLLLIESESDEIADALTDGASTDTPVWNLAVRAARSSRQNHGNAAGSRRWVWRALVAASLVGLLAVPIPLRISAEGYYWPQRRANLFAPDAGVIVADDLFLSDGRQVTEGQLLLTITSEELELQLSQVDGQIATVAEQIRSLQSTRSARGNSNSRPTVDQDVSIRLAEFNARLAGLQQERKLLADRLTALQLSSPLTGEILNWEPAAELEGRPVARGQLLLTVGDLQGEWNVIAEVRDHDLGWFKRAVAENPEVQITVSSSVQPASSGSVRLISPVMREIGPGEYAAQVKIAQPDPPFKPLPGTRAVISVDCGRFPAGYVWFRRLIDTIRNQLTW